MGEFETADNIMDIFTAKQLDLETDVPSSSSVPGDADERLAYYERKYDEFVRRRKHIKTAPDLYIKSLQRETIDSFMKACIAMKRCENCSAFSPPFRKDGATKIFQKPLPKRQQKQMAPLKLKLKSAIEALASNREDDDSDEDVDDMRSDDTDDEESDSNDENNAEHADAEMKESDKYFTPMEVEAQMSMLWKRSGEIMNFIWTRSLGLGLDIDLKTAESWRLFFTRVVIVPPNKFRPASVVADRVNEHPQNTHLRKIIEENSKLRLLQHQSTESLADGAGAGVHLSKIVTGLIALQTAVNGLMDSSKGAPPAGDKKDANIGVRQLLERKEGLFRRNMMGKRVNYCCRSVISPDNNLGTNEVGIPVHFAKELHYPVAVNDHNIQYLRKLVERGPNQYPGKFLFPFFSFWNTYTHTKANVSFSLSCGQQQRKA
jgi:DNA-directed RNA polymerase I subunit RPA1